MRSCRRDLSIVHSINNHFYILKGAKNSALSFYNPVLRRLEHVEKRSFMGSNPKMRSRPSCMPDESGYTDISLQVWQAWKDLLVLAGSLEQRRSFKQIYLARPIVPLSNKDIGYLPGDMKAKVNPYMQPLWDNLKFIKNQFGAGQAAQADRRDGQSGEDPCHATGLHQRKKFEQCDLHCGRSAEPYSA